MDTFVFLMTLKAHQVAKNRSNYCSINYFPIKSGCQIEQNSLGLSNLKTPIAGGPLLMLMAFELEYCDHQAERTEPENIP